VTGSTGGVTYDLPAVRRRACSGTVCHRVERVADIEMRGVRKRKGGTGDVNPITTVDLPFWGLGWPSSVNQMRP